MLQLLGAGMFITGVPGLLALWLYVRGLARRVDDLESIRLLDAAERARMQDALNELRHGIDLLIAQIRRAGMVPEWLPTPIAVIRPRNGQQAETDRMVDLWQRIETSFSLEEMTDLGFQLGIGESRTETAGARARELVNAARRRHLLDNLVDLCREERPNGGF